MLIFGCTFRYHQHTPLNSMCLFKVATELAPSHPQSHHSFERGSTQTIRVVVGSQNSFFGLTTKTLTKSDNFSTYCTEQYSTHSDELQPHNMFGSFQ